MSDVSNRDEAVSPNVRSERLYGRRALMIGAVAGLGATTTLLASAQPAAAQGEAVEVGGSYPDATSVTAITNASGDALQGITEAGGAAGVRGDDVSSGGGNAVYGTSTNGTGVQGQSDTGSGVWGNITASGNASPAAKGTTVGSGDGVYGEATSGNGLHGAAASGSGVYGTSQGGVGVQGEASGTNTQPAVQGSTSAGGVGVLGLATHDISSGTAGVHGDSTPCGAGVIGTVNGVGGPGTLTCDGVQGFASDWDVGSTTASFGCDSVGVHGFSGATGQFAIRGDETSAAGGTAVAGASANGVGGSFSSNHGTALQVQGVATFTRSGSVQVPAGTHTHTVTGVSLSTSSLVLATLQNLVDGVFVRAVVPDVAAKRFQIVLSANVPAGKVAHVGWFIVN